MAFIIIKQVAIMFLLMLMGYKLFKHNRITKEGSKTLANLLIYVILPCVIINGFCTDMTSQKFIGLVMSAVMAFICHACSVFISRLTFKNNSIGIFASSFSNPGFFGIPLITAVYDSEAVFYIAVFIALLNIEQWTYGVALLKGEKIKISIKEIVLSPFMISMSVGLIIFLIQIPIPSILKGVLSNVCNANTMIAMLLMGVYIAQSDLRKLFVIFNLYKISFVRLLIIPVLCLLLLKIIPCSQNEIKMCVLIAAACPVGANVAVYAQLYDKDYIYSVQTVAISTLLSIITMPLIVYLGEVFL